MFWESQLQRSASPVGPEPSSAALTLREIQVMCLIAEGLSNKEIAVRLGIAVHTAKSHVHNILVKLALSTRLEVAVMVHVEDRHARLAGTRQVA
ncbi:MAG: helix-turn-helix transcriptional regulator [Gemmatimonadales bacterium]